jgi:hypothetical protein
MVANKKMELSRGIHIFGVSDLQPYPALGHFFFIRFDLITRQSQLP